MQMSARKPSEGELESLGVSRWPIWTKEVSTFPWHYDSQETCFLLEGRVTVTAADGEVLSFGAGDLVIFEEGLDCTWQVHEPVRKHYHFA